MAISSAQIKCFISNCNEDNTYPCRGCSREFCFDHLTEHRQSLNEQLNLIQDDFNQFRQNLIDMKTNSRRHRLFEQIDQWENESIRKIKDKGNEYRQILDDYTKQSVNELEIKLNEQFYLNEKQKKDFNEIYLNQLREKLAQLNGQLNQLDNLFIEQKSHSFISEISIRFDSQQKQTSISNRSLNPTWKQSATTVVGGHGQEKGSNQLSSSYGMLIDDDQTILIADTENHRIVEWKKNSNNSQTVAGGNGRGNRNNQLDRPISVSIDHQTDSLIICDFGNERVVRWPRRNGQTGEILISNIHCCDLKMSNDGYLYVCNTEEHEIRRWRIGEENGTIVAGGNGEGNRTDQLNSPDYIFIGEDHSVYVSDAGNHRVMKWVKGAKEGIVVAGGHGDGDELRQLSCPNGIIVDELGSVYVVDSGNDRVMRWLKGAAEGTIVVGGNGRGEEANQLNRPIDISFDREKNLYVFDLSNHRVQRFDIN